MPSHIDLLVAQMEIAFNYLPGIAQDRFVAILIGREADQTAKIEEAYIDRGDEKKYPGGFVKPKIIVPEQFDEGRPKGIIIKGPEPKK